MEVFSFLTPEQWSIVFDSVMGLAVIAFPGIAVYTKRILNTKNQLLDVCKKIKTADSTIYKVANDLEHKLAAKALEKNLE